MRESLAILLAVCTIGCGGGTGTEDSGTVAPDSGPRDSGQTMNDSGMTEMDAGSDSGPFIDTDGGPPPVDAGTDAFVVIDVDAGPSSCTPAPGTVTLSDRCDAVTACGGPLLGMHCYQSICLTRSDLVGMDRDLFPGCSTALFTVRDVTGTVNGTIDFTTTTVTRDVAISIDGSIDIPVTCAPSFVPNICAETASGIDNGIEMTLGAGTAEVSCTSVGGGGCTCTVAIDYARMDASPYTATGGVVMTGAGREYRYCNMGGAMRVVDQTSGSAPEPGVQTLTP
jgi:hypothetical protein